MAFYHRSASYASVVCGVLADAANHLDRLGSSARFGLAIGHTLAIGHAPLTALAFASLANLTDYFPCSFVNSS